MAKFPVITQFGYIEEDSTGNIISRAVYPKGETELSAGFTYKECATKAEYDALVLYKEPQTAEQQYELKIQAKIRETAISTLKIDGKLPAEFTDKEIYNNVLK